MNSFSRELNFHFALLLSFYSPTSFSNVSLGIGHHLGAKIWICVLVHRAPFPDSRVFLSSCSHPLNLPHPTLNPSCSCAPRVFLFNVPRRKQRQGDESVTSGLSPAGLILSWFVEVHFFCTAEPQPFTAAPFQYSLGGFHCLFM